MADKLVVVGASLAGIKAVQELRLLGYGDAITLIGAEPHGPYDRPPLSKGFLSGTVSADDLRLVDDDALAALDVELLLGTEATGLDVESMQVQCGDRRVDYDRLLIATGASPRRPTWFRGLPGLHVLRSIDDADGLRADIAAAETIVVVGGGFIGTEAAAHLTASGKRVTVVTDADTLVPPLGTHMADLVTELHRSRGVGVVTGAVVDGLLGDDRVRGVELADGRTIAADAVLVSIGAVPETRWLNGSLVSDNGSLTCDPDGRVNETVWAAGDVTSQGAGHWFSAVNQARRVARSMLGVVDNTTRRLEQEVRYMWTDQFEFKVQMLGVAMPGDEFTVVSQAEPGSPEIAGLFSRDGMVSGGVVVNRPRDLAVVRRVVGAAEPLESALDSFPRKVVA
ncbi:NAD(P)/FAD-dependent oxidoreductase [Rhodococcus artemisiae]|uniref:FAD-dependent oxidoreductase n=1 Tax=Rhodococcus artemisiae TaxID=714159 RepID=A0ABU7LHR3_9NOCA|nr:FAD-dependent oxidoreductase [Rhodococcus artemisiae]MEE2060417.1 FAD-dependent oxidoreductase [Rhodococcus artemisiae]